MQSWLFEFEEKTMWSPAEKKAFENALVVFPQDRKKKTTSWTGEEHKLFLMGLKKYGKGDWRNISRNYVITRTPTQVACHAQKYFIRQMSGGEDNKSSQMMPYSSSSSPPPPPPPGRSRL